MEAHNEPSAEEAASFFAHLPSKPFLLARTNCGTPYHQMIRVLAPIEDAAIIGHWSDVLRQALLDCIQDRTPRLQWTGLMPVRIEARQRTTGWQDALAVALECKAVLAIHGIVNNMDVAVVEMEVVAACGSGGETLLPASTTNKNVELQDIFDIRFSKFTFNQFFAGINLDVLPFLPLPGESLQPLDSSDPGKELPAGSLACYVRLEDDAGNLSRTLYALTCRHVAAQEEEPDHDPVSNKSSNKSSNKDIALVCGSLEVIGEQKRCLLSFQRRGPGHLHRATKIAFSRGQPSDAELAGLELMSECATAYLEAIQAGLAALESRDENSSRTRHVGTVAYHSAEHSVDAEGYWNDWALVAVSPSDSPSSSTQYKGFYRSDVFLGNWGDVIGCIAELLSDLDDIPSDYYSMTPYNSEDVELLSIKAPRPPPMPLLRAPSPDSGKTASVRPVLKRGAASTLTVGLLSPIEAVLRRPLPAAGPAVLARAWPVFSSPLHPVKGLVFHGQFSVGGDSGSLVFDMDGVAVGMVDAGFGRGANTTAEVQVDVSLISPIDRIFASIQEVTGQTPRII